MAIQEQKKQSRAHRPRLSHSGNEQITGAHRDVDVLQMVATEAQARAADHHARAALAAYYRAEKRGFEPGHELEDWFAAETDVGARQLSAAPSMQSAKPESA